MFKRVTGLQLESVVKYFPDFEISESMPCFCKSVRLPLTKE